jgi:threonylcarbamoyladenosine tRNA methylthiotransferase MtaB
MVKVQDGCDRRCAYCIVPVARGRARSVRRVDVLAAVERAVRGGAPEVVLTGIDVGRYEDGDSRLPDLISEVCATDVHRVRISSIEPQEITEELLRGLSRQPKVCRHLHIPLQSGSDAVLEAMGRGYSAKEYLDLVGRVREALPGVGITTDVMVGYPGETAEDARATERVCRQAGFSKLHVFRYSPRPGTRAAGLEQLDAPIVAERAESLRAVGEELRASFVEALLGTAAEIVVESIDGAGDEARACGTSREYLKVSVPANGLLTGDVVSARLIAREADEVVAEVLGKA